MVCSVGMENVSMFGTMCACLGQCGEVGANVNMKAELRYSYNTLCDASTSLISD